MDMIKRIGVIFLILAIFSVMSFLYVWLSYKLRQKRYPDYDRTLNLVEEKYVQNAAKSLIAERALTQANAPRWYSIFLYCSFLPTMFLSWIVVGLVFGVLFLAFGMNLKDIFALSNADLTSNWDNGAIGLLGGGVAGILLAGWVLYSLSQRTDELAKFVALKSDMHGFDLDAIHARQVALIEHQIRMKTIILPHNFDVLQFLRGRNESYKVMCRRIFIWVMLSSLGVSAVMLFVGRA